MTVRSVSHFLHGDPTAESLRDFLLRKDRHALPSHIFDLLASYTPKRPSPGESIGSIGPVTVTANATLDPLIVGPFLKVSALRDLIPSPAQLTFASPDQLKEAFALACSKGHLAFVRATVDHLLHMREDELPPFLSLGLGIAAFGKHGALLVELMRHADRIPALDRAAALHFAALTGDFEHTFFLSGFDLDPFLVASTAMAPLQKFDMPTFLLLQTRTPPHLRFVFAATATLFLIRNAEREHPAVAQMRALFEDQLIAPWGAFTPEQLELLESLETRVEEQFRAFGTYGLTSLVPEFVADDHSVRRTAFSAAIEAGHPSMALALSRRLPYYELPEIPADLQRRHPAFLAELDRAFAPERRRATIYEIRNMIALAVLVLAVVYFTNTSTH